MDIQSFLFPKEAFAIIIWYIQIGFFLFWLLLLFSEIAKHRRIQWDIKKFADINQLLEIKRKIVKESYSDEVLERNFDDYGKSLKIPKKTLIAKHLKTIFQTGLRESNLDINLLLKNSTNQLLSTNIVLRSLISLFIIIGLLGTLGGLSLSLSELSLITESKLTSEIITEALKKLLPKLGVAFATSFWGVLFTIIGLTLYAFVQRLIILPTVYLLENETITNWVPRLIPTPSQILQEKLLLTEKQMQSNYVHLKEVGKFAHEIKDETSLLNKSVKEARTALDVLEDASENLVGFSEIFTKGVNDLMSFQEDFRQLNQQMVADSKRFNNTVERELENNKAFQQNILSEFKEYTEKSLIVYSNNLAQNETSIKFLKTYESDIIKSWQSIDTKLNELLDVVQQSLQKTAHHNQNLKTEIIPVINQLPQEDLLKILTRVSLQLEKGFSDISNFYGEIKNLNSNINTSRSKDGANRSGNNLKSELKPSSSAKSDRTIWGRIRRYLGF